MSGDEADRSSEPNKWMYLKNDMERYGAVSVYQTRDNRFRVSCGPDVLPAFAGPAGRWFVSVVDADDVLGEILQALVKAVGPNGPPRFGVVMNQASNLMVFEFETVLIFPTDCGFHVTVPSNPTLSRFEVDPIAAATSALRLLEESQEIRDAFYSNARTVHPAFGTFTSCGGRPVDPADDPSSSTR